MLSNIFGSQNVLGLQETMETGNIKRGRITNTPVCRVRQNSTRSRACKAAFRPLLLVTCCLKKKLARAPAIFCSLVNTVKSVYIKKEFLSDQKLISFDDIIL